MSYPVSPGPMAEMDKLIQAQVQRIAHAQYGAFRCDGAFLFLHDPYAQLLEPAFDSHERPYQRLGAVSTHYGTLESVRQHPHSSPYSGIATVAFQDGSAFSRNPKTDYRLGHKVLALHDDYGIMGSMMAVRLDCVIGEVLGVVVVYAKDILDGLSDQDETRLLDTFGRDLGRLTSLLQRWRQAKAEGDVRRYNEFVLDWAHDVHGAKTAEQTCLRFVKSMTRLFGAETVHVNECGPEMSRRWIPPVAEQQASALDGFGELPQGNEDAELCKAFDSLTLNREHQHPALFEKLNEAFASGHVWCRVGLELAGRRLICVAARRAESVGDHWSPNDVTLFCYGLRLLEVKLRRSRDFDALLPHLTTVNGQDTKSYDFDFLCHVLKDYFGIDQVLLTKVKRKPDRYTVCAEMTCGFGQHDAKIRSRPKDFIPAVGVPSRPDIMIRILVDFLDARGKDVYVGNVADEHPNFTLDRDLVAGCGLKGNIYFVTCCTPATDGEGPTLKSVLHLGAADGRLEIPHDSLPLIRTLGVRVAEWLAREDSRRIARTIRQIRNVDQCSLRSFRGISESVAKACFSLGCTIFISARHLRQFGAKYGTVELLQELMVRFVNGYDGWEELPGDGRQRLVCMFSAFLGTNVAETEEILSGADRAQAARLAARFLYVRAVQSNAGHDLEELSDLMARQEGMSHAEVISRLGRFLCENAYLPGYGLTGWVLRYQHPMLLADKQAATLARFFNACRDSLLPPCRQPIINMLRIIEGPRSVLEANEFQPPQHADHVSEDPARNNPQDTYLAWPLEGIQSAHEPLGVIRISNAASLRRHFGPDESTTVQAAARHISHLLLREYMQQESYLEGVLADRGNEEEFYHCISRLNEKIMDLDDQLREDPSYLPEPRRGELQALVKRLREICDSALAGPQLRIIVLRIRSEDTSAWTVRELAALLQEWISTVNLGATVTALDSERIRGIQHRNIVWWCLVAEELVKNLRRHQEIKRPAVFLKGIGATRLYVASPHASEMLDRPTQWDPYGRLWEGKEKGGGARLLEGASELAAVAVEFAYVDSPEHEHGEMIARVTSQEGRGQ